MKDETWELLVKKRGKRSVIHRRFDSVEPSLACGMFWPVTDILIGQRHNQNGDHVYCVRLMMIGKHRIDLEREGLFR